MRRSYFIILFFCFLLTEPCLSSLDNEKKEIASLLQQDQLDLSKSDLDELYLVSAIGTIVSFASYLLKFLLKGLEALKYEVNHSDDIFVQSICLIGAFLSIISWNLQTKDLARCGAILSILGFTFMFSQLSLTLGKIIKDKISSIKSSGTTKPDEFKHDCRVIKPSEKGEDEHFMNFLHENYDAGSDIKARIEKINQWLSESQNEEDAKKLINHFFLTHAKYALPDIRHLIKIFPGMEYEKEYQREKEKKEANEKDEKQNQYQYIYTRLILASFVGVDVFTEQEIRKTTKDKFLGIEVLIKLAIDQKYYCTCFQPHEWRDKSLKSVLDVEDLTKIVEINSALEKKCGTKLNANQIPQDLLSKIF